MTAKSQTRKATSRAQPAVNAKAKRKTPVKEAGKGENCSHNSEDKPQEIEIGVEDATGSREEVAEPASKVPTDSPWSDWIWSSDLHSYYRARKGADDTWNYEYTEPSPPLIAPKQQAPQLAPVEKIEYPKEKVLYAKKEYSYKILQDATRGEYLLAVCEEKIWDPKEDVDVKPAVAVKKVEEKSAEKPVAPVEEKKESPAVGANKKAAKRSQADADGDNTERKYGEKGVKMKTVGVERVPEWRTNVDAVQKAEVDKKSRNTSEIKSKDKPKTRKEKKVYIEDDSEDEIKEIKRRGKRQHTK